MQSSNRAQSEAVGAILLLGVVVVSVSVFGAAFILDQQNSAGPRTEGEVHLTTHTLQVTHGGGADLDAADLAVVVSTKTGQERVQFADGTSTPDDGVFSPGDDWVYDGSPFPLSDGEQVTVSLVHEPSRTVVFSESKTAESPWTTIRQPDDDDAIKGDSTYEVFWMSSFDVERVDVAYSTDGGSSWTAVETGEPNVGSYSWSVPAITDSSVLLRVADADGPATDQVGPFEIDSDTPDVTNFDAKGNQGDIDVSFDSSEQLADVRVEIESGGSVVATLTEGDFAVQEAGGKYKYESSYTPSQNGDYTVTLTRAEDEVGHDGADPDVHTEQVTITKAGDGDGGGDSNSPPTADATVKGNANVKEGNSANLASESTDSDGTITSYTWEVVSGPGTLDGANSDKATYNAPENVDEDTSVTIQLTVTDDDGATDTDTVTLTVENKGN